MTQNLLDVTTFLNTNSDSTFKSASKEFTESFLNGKSFSDILTKSNDNYATSDFNQNMANSNNSLNDFKDSFNDNNKFETKEKVSDNNERRESDNNKTETKDSDENKETESKVDEKDETTAKKDADETKSKKDVKNDVVAKDDKNLLLKDDKEAKVLVDEVLTGKVEVEVENTVADTNSNANSLESLIKMYQVEEPVEKDAQIDAYYKSALDVTTVQTEQLEAAIENLKADELDVKVDLLDAKALDTKKAVTTDVINLAKNQNAKKVDKDAVLNQKGVEVKVATGEENVAQTDVMVKASEEVVNNLGKIDTTKSEKYDAKAIMRKAGLEESDLETLAVKLAEASTTGGESNTGAFTSQGNVQEDLAKMAVKGLENIESTSKSSEPFSNMVESAKNAQQPKHITMDKDILNQISAKMQAQNINGQQKITLMLTPESLGKVTIELVKGHSGIEAKLLTDNANVKELLEKNLDTLKTSFGNQGVNVNSVNVKVASVEEGSSDFSSFERNDFGGNEGNAQQQFSNSDSGNGGSNYEGYNGSRLSEGRAEMMPEDALEEVETVALDDSNGVDLEV